MKKNFVILILIFVPGVLREMFVSMYFHDWGIDKIRLEKYNNHVNLLGNISPFLLGTFMLINPNFFVKIFLKILEKISKDDIEKINPLYATLALRALGVLLIILSIISSQYLLGEIQ